MSKNSIHDLTVAWDWSLFTSSEKKFMRHCMALQSVGLGFWLSEADGAVSEADHDAWGIEDAILITLAKRVLRHKTGVMVIPELLGAMVIPELLGRDDRKPNTESLKKAVSELERISGLLANALFKFKTEVNAL